MAPDQRPDVVRLADPEVTQRFASKLEEALKWLDATADPKASSAAGASIPRKPRGKRTVSIFDDGRLDRGEPQSSIGGQGCPVQDAGWGRH